MPLAFLATGPFGIVGTSCKSPACHLIQYLFILGLGPKATNSACESWFLVLFIYFFCHSRKMRSHADMWHKSVRGSGDSGDRDWNNFIQEAIFLCS